MLMPSLDTSIANVPLPTLTHAFTEYFQEVQWIVLACLLAITTMIVSVGRLGDIVGADGCSWRESVCSRQPRSCAAFAPTLWLLIIARSAQGLGAAVMMALTVAMVAETVPKEGTGSAMGLLGTMSAIGTTLGPSLGGILIAGLGWRVIFLVNVPLGILNVLLAHTVELAPNVWRGPEFYEKFEMGLLPIEAAEMLSRFTHDARPDASGSHRR